MFCDRPISLHFYTHHTRITFTVVKLQKNHNLCSKFYSDQVKGFNLITAKLVLTPLIKLQRQVMFYQEKKTSVGRNNQEQYMYFVQCSGVGITCP